MEEKTRVLLVEDEALIAEDIKRLVERLGYKVVAIAMSGEEADKIAEEVSPDLILMDIILGGDFDGIETARKIKERMDVPIIYVTAHTDQATLERAKMTEPHGYLLKPFQIQELQSTIETSLYKHRIEKRLKESEQLLTDIVESISEGILVLDQDFRYTYWNKAMEKISKTPRKNLLADKRPAWEIFPHLKKQGVDKMMKKAMKGAIVQREDIPYHLEDGTEGYTSETFLPLKGGTGEIKGIIGVVREITEKREIERKLKLFKHMVEQSNHGVAVSDLDGNLIFVNNAFAGLHGYSREELAGKHFSIFHNPEQIPCVRDANRELREKGVFKGEIWHVKKDGQVFPSLMHNSLLYDEEENPVAMISMIWDISGQKKAEEKLIKSESLLKNIVSAAPVGLGLVKDWTFVWANPHLESMLKYSPGTLIGQKTRVLFDDKTYNAVEKVKYNGMKKKGIGRMETKLRTRTGHFINVNLTLSPINPDDITEGIVFSALEKNVED